MKTLRRRSMILFAMIATWTATGAVAAQDVATPPFDPLRTLREAEADYDLGIELLASRPNEAEAAFAKSAAGFESVIDSGVENARLHFNLGNALLQSGDRGGAIVEYLRAGALDPADPDIAANLAFARSQVPGRPAIGEDPSIADRLATWWHVVPLRWRAAIALGLWMLFWSLLVVRQAGVAPRTGERRLPWPAVLGVTATLALVLGATVVLDLDGLGNSGRAVVVSDGVVLRKGNGDGFAPEALQPLESGIECRVIEHRPGWTRIGLDDGRSGWLPETSIERVAISAG